MSENVTLEQATELYINMDAYIPTFVGRKNDKYRGLEL